MYFLAETTKMKQILTNSERKTCFFNKTEPITIPNWKLQLC